MQIDNIEESKILLLEIEQLFIELDDIKKELESKIDLKGAEQEDYLHELELGNLSGLEILKVSKGYWYPKFSMKNMSFHISTEEYELKRKIDNLEIEKKVYIDDKNK